jgi:hypothetical protein
MGLSPVYSQPFILYTGDSPNTEYLVPAGFTAVVRDFTGFASVAATLLQLQLFGPGASSGPTFAQIELAAAQAYAQWTGRVVALPGYTVQLVVGDLGAGVSAYVGGYLLRNVID